MANLNTLIQALASTIATYNKEISGRVGALADLDTSDKTSIVAAINALKTYAQSDDFRAIYAAAYAGTTK